MPAQAQAFAAAVGAGVASALVYDLLRCLRRATRAGMLVTGALDLVFWTAAAGMTAAAGALCGVKGLRYYMLFGALCGFAIWEAGVRRWLYLRRCAARSKENKEGNRNGTRKLVK